MQRPSIESAKELGYKTLVVDANPNAVCVPFADRFEKVDLKDMEGIAKLALSMKDEIAGIFTAGTDFSASVSYASEKCSLVSHSFQAALNASNKVLMRECFARENVPSPDFFEADEKFLQSLNSITSAKIEFPKVVKPVDNMGARGCRLVRCTEEFVPALREAISYSRTGKAIVEDYMAGPEFSIDALVFNGNVTITGFADRHIFFEPYFIELGHTMPSQCSAKMKGELVETFKKGIKALGLTNGVAKADIKYTEKGPMIGEIAGRLSGGYMSGWTFPYSSGVKNLFFRVAEGSEVDFPRNNVEKCGNVISLSENRQLSLWGAESAVAQIVLRLEVNNRKTEEFLAGIELPHEKGFPYSAYAISKEDASLLEKQLAEAAEIPENGKVSELIPPVLSGKENMRDWNYRTIEKTAELFDTLCSVHKAMDSKKFWKYMIRGGIQAVLYYADSL